MAAPMQGCCEASLSFVLSDATVTSLGGRDKATNTRDRKKDVIRHGRTDSYSISLVVVADATTAKTGNNPLYTMGKASKNDNSSHSVEATVIEDHHNDFSDAMESTDETDELTVVTHRRNRTTGIPVLLLPGTEGFKLQNVNPLHLSIHKEGLLVDIAEESAVKWLLKVTELCGVAIKAPLPRAYTQNKGLIKGIPRWYTVERLAEYLQPQGVAAVRRLYQRNGITTETTQTDRVVLSFRPNSERPSETSDVRFVGEYRLTKGVTRWLCDQLRRKLQRRREGPRVLTVEQQVLAGLRYYAAGGFQGTVVSDENIGVHQCSVSRVLVDVTNAIIDCLGSKWLCFEQFSGAPYGSQSCAFDSTCRVPPSPLFAEIRSREEPYQVSCSKVDVARAPAYDPRLLSAALLFAEFSHVRS
ncbi:hypothetical protein HPB47_017521 [Ixodes persulcatus]|uniref:Uncharacterized protein n=1 Tax=Ixodes persulcatus TaxID=34615 RepID=A0AC60QRR6_IXOPE|nr:hypothetical protein HPB47_017521 [Ixodes persulcatus]